MPLKDPNNWEWVAWATGFFMSAIGGAIGYYLNIKKTMRKFNFMEFFIESGVNFFIAFAAFMALYGTGVNYFVAAPICSLIAHNATRYLFLFDNILTRKIKSFGDNKNQD